MINIIVNFTKGIIHLLYPFWVWICWRIAGILVYLSFRYSRFLEILKRQFQFNKKMARHGTLFLSLGLIFLGTKPTNTNASTGLIPVPPGDWSPIVRAGLSAFVFVLVIFIFWMLRKYGLFTKIKRAIITKILVLVAIGALILFALWLLPTLTEVGSMFLGKFACAVSGVFIIAVFWKWLSEKLFEFIDGPLQYGYWAVFWMVFSIGWLKGMNTIASTDSSWPFIIGYIWFFIIGIILLKSAWKIKK